MSDFEVEDNLDNLVDADSSEQDLEALQNEADVEEEAVQQDGQEGPQQESFDDLQSKEVEAYSADEGVESSEDEKDAKALKEEFGLPTEEEIRQKLKGLEGKWYVLHTYSGYEKRVKRDVETRIHSMNMEDMIFQVEVKRGQRKLVSRVRMPGYALIRMNLTDDSWRVVQSTNGVTGFVGNGRNPVPLSENEVVKMLTPVLEAEAAAKAKEAGKPTKKKTITVSPFEIGESVTLVSEPWAGMPATVSDIDAENQRLTVMMTLVGQETPVEL